MAGVWTMGEILVEIMRPRPGIELFEPAEFLGPFPSGAPAIFIDTVARLGHPACIIGGVGNDDFGRCVLDRLQADGVNCDYILKSAEGATAVAFVTYFDDGSRKFIYHIDGTPAVMAEFRPADSVDIPQYFHIMGCSLMASEIFRARILEAMNFFHERGARISFDPNIRPELLGERDVMDVAGPVLENCSILLPGAAELALLSAKNDIHSGARHLLDTTPLEIIVVKRGRKGCSVFSGEDSFDVSPYPVEEVDPTGAGDCFDAGFLCGLMEDLPIKRCAQMAAAAGALNASAFGPMEGAISRETVESLIGGSAT